MLANLARSAPPSARIDRLMKLGKGTALAIDSDGMAALHEEMAERLHGALSQQDAQPLRLHVTIQNKVTAEQACALQRELGVQLRPVSFRFHGFGLYAWEEGLWRPLRTFAFRG